MEKKPFLQRWLNSVRGEMRDYPKQYKLLGNAALFLAGMAAATAISATSQSSANQAESNANSDRSPTPAAAAAQCDTNQSRIFSDASRRINLTGETGTWISAGYGRDDDCQSFVFKEYQQWQAMLGRHSMQMGEPEQAAAFRQFVDGIGDQIREQYGTLDINEPAQRRLLIHMVNSWITKAFTYKTDNEAFFNSDYYATPTETLRASGAGGHMAGDCDDYTAVKFLVLREFGIDPNDMLATIVGQTGADNFDHMVLMVRDGDAYLVLDNARGADIYSSHDAGYRSFMAFNGTGAYAFPQAMLSAGMANLTSLQEPQDNKLGTSVHKVMVPWGANS